MLLPEMLGAGRTGILIGLLANHNTHPHVFVSVASKGLSRSVSLLFATLAGRLISVDSKWFRETGR
jgi:hypothetical protein